MFGIRSGVGYTPKASLGYKVQGVRYKGIAVSIIRSLLSVIRCLLLSSFSFNAMLYALCAMRSGCFQL